MIILRRPVRTPRIPRKERAQRVLWRMRASERTYLTEHPEREIAFEKDGAARCQACGVTYQARPFERLLSPAALRAQRWAHSHNAARHPRRWIREQHFQAPIPIEVRNRAACTCVEDVVCGPCMTGAVA